MEKKKILFRLRSMEMGGVQKVLLGFLENIDQSKFELCLLLNLKQGSLLQQIPKNIRVVSLAEGKENFSQNKYIRLLQLLKRRALLKTYDIAPSLYKKKLNFIPGVEVAFFHLSLKDLLRSPFKNSKKINWFHSDIRFFPDQKTALQTTERMKACDVSVFVSKKTQQNVEEFSQGSLKNGTTIHNPFDLKEILDRANEIVNLPKNKQKTFVSIGRLVPQKGYDLLLEVHKELLKEGFSHQIQIIGDGIERKNIEAKRQEYQLENSFSLLGQQENPLPFVKNADFYIQPSRYEAYPLAIGEALILNKPIITTNSGGVCEIVTPNKTALVVDFEKEQLKNAMKFFLQHPEHCQQMIAEQKTIDFEENNKEIFDQIQTLFSTPKK